MQNDNVSVDFWTEQLRLHIPDMFISSDEARRNDIYQLSLPECLRSIVLPKWGPQLKYVICYGVERCYEAWTNDETHSLDDLKILRDCGLQIIYEDDILDLLRIKVEEHVSQTVRGVYDRPVLPDILDFIKTRILRFAENIFTSQKLSEIQLMFQSFANDTLSCHRANELFDIVTDFPDSSAAVVELRNICDGEYSFKRLGRRFRSDLKRRLLHTGASTHNIIYLYVSMIRSLRLLDPSNILLNYVAKPVRKYLMSRKDTIRCIVSSLTGREDLHNELRAGGSLEYGLDSDDEFDGVSLTWSPPKRALGFPGAGSQDKDVLALLVSIYGSTDLFVNEYRSVLADRLLQNHDYAIDNEVATLELLKIRFGEDSLHSCEVMLHDVDSSKRLNIAKDSVGVVDCTVISDSYWPSLQCEEFNHHPQAATLLSSFVEDFAVKKKPKRLQMVPQLGQVTIELDFDGCIKEFNVNPLQATLILHIADESSVSLPKLAALCDVSEADVQRKMTYWISRGVVRETHITSQNGEGGVSCNSQTIVYEVIADQNRANDSDNGESLAGVHFEAADNDDIFMNSGLSSEAQESATSSVYEAYIKGMLLSQESMHLERIHGMLKLIVSGNSDGSRFDMTIVQLRKFLQTMVTAGSLEMVDGLYRVRQSSSGKS